MVCCLFNYGPVSGFVWAGFLVECGQVFSLSKVSCFAISQSEGCLPSSFVRCLWCYAGGGGKQDGLSSRHSGHSNWNSTTERSLQATAARPPSFSDGNRQLRLAFQLPIGLPWSSDLTDAQGLLDTPDPLRLLARTLPCAYNLRLEHHYHGATQEQLSIRGVIQPFFTLKTSQH